MKKLFALFASIAVILSSALVSYAANGSVTYDGGSQRFIFEPGSSHSPTDLFDSFKDVMPGDVLTQRITVKNDSANGVKVKIYLRALGAHEDSVDFLSKLHLTVSKHGDMDYMFDAQADETAQLGERVCLGTLYSGGEVELDVTLTVPLELSNEYQDSIGYLDWEFAVEELPIEPDDPLPPTGDDSNMPLWVMLAVASLLIIFAIIKKKFKQTSNA